MTVRDNIERGLRHLGLSSYVVLTEEGEDRMWGWPTPELEKYCQDNHWFCDPCAVAAHEHGAGTRSYREPDGLHPAMQLCFHPQEAGADFVELDYDYAAPVDVVGIIEHGIEVASNEITGGKTDQDRISRMLDKRFGVS